MKEAKLKEAIQKAQLEHILEAIAEGVMVTDARGRFIYANTMAEKLLDMSRSDIIGRTFSDAVWKMTINGKPVLEKDLPHTYVMATGKPLTGVQMSIKRTDGVRVLLSVNTTPLFDEEGVVSGLVTSFTDVTERQQSEMALLESEARYRRLVELSPDPVVVHSEGIIVYMNPAGVKLLDAAGPEEIVGKPVLSFVHPDYLEIVKERFQLQQQGKNVGLIEEKFIRLDGQVIDVEVAASPISFHGKLASIVIIRDITERKKAEERLKESERRFREMLEKAQLAAIMLNAQGKITFVNDFLLNLTGWQREEIVGKDWFDALLPPDQQEDARSVFFASMAHGTISAQYNYDVVTRWGARRTISFNNVILRDLRGNVIGMASIGEDITEQQRLLNELTALSQVTDIAMSTLNLGELLDSLLMRLVEVVGADTAVILLKEGNQLLARASVGLEEEVRQGYSIRIGHGFAGTIAKTAKSLYVADAQTDPRVINPIIKQRGVRSMLGVPMMREGSLIGVLHINWLSMHPKSESELHLLEVAADRCAMAITNAQLHEKTKESGRLISALNNINAIINSTLDFDEIMGRVVKEAARAMGCETAAVDLREGDRWVVKYLYGPSQELVGTRFTDEESKHSALAAITRRPVVINDALNDERVNHEVVEKHNLRSFMVVPLIEREDVIGVLFFGYYSATIAFNDAQVDFADKLGSAVALALKNALLCISDRNIADTLQEAMFTVPQHLYGIEVGHLHRAATGAARTGGDFYDLFEIEHGKVGIVMGGVSGKGMEAAALTSVVKNAIKAHAYEDDAPGVVMAKTNDVVLKTAPPHTHVTVFFGVLDVATGRLTYSSAGHPPAIIKRSTSDVELLTRNSPPMGTLSGLRYKIGKGTLKEGDVLLVYTGGVTEAQCNGRLLSEERLINFIKQLEPKSTKELPQVIFNKVMDCTDGKLVNDVAFLTISLKESAS